MRRLFQLINRYLGTMSSRERFLLLIFLGTAIFFWGLYGLTRIGDIRAQHASVNRTLETQQVWLDSAADIRARMEREVGLLEPGQMLTATRLVAELNNMARRQDLSPTIDSPRTESGDAFQFHTVIIRLSRAPLSRVIAFTDAVQDRSPYMALNHVILTPDRSNPNNLEARFEITSVEVVASNE